MKYIVSNGSVWHGPFESEIRASRYGYERWGKKQQKWEILKLYPPNISKLTVGQPTKEEYDLHYMSGRSDSL